MWFVPNGLQVQYLSIKVELTSFIFCRKMADKDLSDNKTGTSNEEKDDLGDDLPESLGSQSSGLTSSSDSYSMPKRQRETSPSRSPIRSESPSAPYRMVPRKCN